MKMGDWKNVPSTQTFSRNSKGNPALSARFRPDEDDLIHFDCVIRFNWILEEFFPTP
jgi:hypothetical protein